MRNKNLLLLFWKEKSFREEWRETTVTKDKSTYFAHAHCCSKLIITIKTIFSHSNFFLFKQIFVSVVFNICSKFLLNFFVCQTIKRFDLYFSSSRGVDMNTSNLFAIIDAVKTGVSFWHSLLHRNSPTASLISTLKSVCLGKNRFKCENDTLFILSSIGNDTFKCLK
jgi:hypothetical protein